MKNYNLQETLELIADNLKYRKDYGQLYMGANSLIKCYERSTDHRIHGQADTLGANSHRFTHSNPNVTQVPRDENFRKLISCPSNKLFVDIDADQLELVMLGHYLGPYDNYAYAEIVEHGDKSKGTDIHTVNQKLVGLPNRDAAKTLNKGC